MQSVRKQSMEFDFSTLNFDKYHFKNPKRLYLEDVEIIPLETACCKELDKTGHFITQSGPDCLTKWARLLSNQ
jgi:hypothetical protein